MEGILLQHQQQHLVQCEKYIESIIICHIRILFVNLHCCKDLQLDVKLYDYHYQMKNLCLKEDAGAYACPGASIKDVVENIVPEIPDYLVKNSHHA